MACDVSKEAFLIQKQIARAVQLLHGYRGPQEVIDFCSTISENESVRLMYSKATTALEINHSRPIEDEDSPYEQGAAESSEESEDEGTQCENCRKRKRKPSKSQCLDTKFKDFDKHAATNVRELINEHWRDLKSGSPEIHRSRLANNETPHTIRLNQHLELRQMTKYDEFRWFWRALALIRNLQSHEEFLDESGYTKSEERLSHKARDKYMKYLYTCRDLNKIEKRARTAFSEQLRYGRRWKIFLDALTAGFLIVCGRRLAMNVIHRTLFTTADLENLAGQIKDSRIYQLCEALRPLSEQLLRARTLDENSDKDSVLAVIERCSISRINSSIVEK